MIKLNKGIGSTSLLPTSNIMLQRKCACGGTAGIDGECEECRSKRLSSQHSAQNIQTKLTLNQPGDKYEQEANQMAERMMQMSEPETLDNKQSGKTEPQIQDMTKNVDLANTQERIQTPLIQRRISSTVTKRIEQDDEIIDRIATEEGIHPNWVRGVIATESGGQATQSAGSGYTGLMQAERGAAQTDPETSIRAGAKKLKAFQTSLGRLLKKHNQDIHSLNEDQVIRLVMVAYNSGPGTLQKAMLYAIASGDIKRWMEPENFQRALIYYGAYSIKDALPSAMRGLEGDTLATELAKLTGASQEIIRTQYFVGNKWNKRGLQQALVQYVDNQRRQLRRKDLTLAQVRTQASHWLLQTVEFKHNNLKNWYVDRVLEYKEHYDQVRPVEYIQFTENEEASQSAEEPGTQVVGERSEAAPQRLRMPETEVIGERSGEHRVQPTETEGSNAAPTVLQRRIEVTARNFQLSNNSLSSVHKILNSPGQPLDIAMRSFMEPRFGHDFSNVRVHTDAQAADSARSVKALAYTVGKNIVFGAGQYASQTNEGKRLLAHELTHVMQQKGHSHFNLAQNHHYIQRQSASTGGPLHTAWDDLPTNARQAIDKTYFNEKLDRESQSAFRSVYSALVSEGLWDDIGRVDKVFPKNVRGIEASSKGDLASKLISNPRFCRDTSIGGSQHSGAVMWRQVVQAGTEGLHVGISGHSRMVAHLDVLAPVGGREPDGSCRYSAPHLLPHILRDLAGWRNLEFLPPPTGKEQPGDVQPHIRISIPGT